jgi:acyl carrier protein
MTPTAAPDERAVLEAIADVARTHLNWTGDLSRDMPIVETFELDSVRQLTLVIEIENRFRVRLDGEDEQSIVTVGDLVSVIRRKLGSVPGNNR